jgi:hypothetical protein
MRKPMTTTELLKKFKSKKTGLAKDELMPGSLLLSFLSNPLSLDGKNTFFS